MGLIQRNRFGRHRGFKELHFGALRESLRATRRRGEKIDPALWLAMAFPSRGLRAGEHCAKLRPLLQCIQRPGGVIHQVANSTIPGSDQANHEYRSQELLRREIRGQLQPRTTEVCLKSSRRHRMSMLLRWKILSHRPA